MPHLAVKLQVVGELNDFAVDAGADEALLEQVFEQIAVFAFLAADQREQGRRNGVRPAVSRMRLDDLLAALGGDRAAAL